ncbi:MAG: carbohydrate binding domain-containing protein [Candidatus Omnitrophota bacterium]
MKKFVLAVLLIAFFAVPCFAEDKILVIDDLEIGVTGGAEGTVDFGAGNGSTVKVASASESFHSGKLALKITYDAVAGGYIFVARGEGLDAKNAGWDIAPDKIDWSKYKAIAFHMYGNDSKNQIAFDFKDKGNEIWRYMITDDFKGWKQVVCPFDQFVARSDWQPDSAEKNTAIDFPLKNYQVEPLPESKGVFYFDTVELIEK